MDERRDQRFFVKCELIFAEEPDWDVLCVGLKQFQDRRLGRHAFKRCELLEDGCYSLPLFIETHLERFRREDRKRVELTDEECRLEFYDKMRTRIESFFGCHVEFTEMTADYLHPEDLMEIEEAFAESRGGFFEPPRAFQAADFMPEKNVQGRECAPFEELDSLIGLESVKEQVRDLARLVKEHGKENLPCLHMVFRGNPGTGKTTVARIIARIFDEAGITDGKDTFVETDRAGLVGAYVGHTALKTQRVLAKAKGGTLFIDEAYALALYDTDRDYGAEAISTLVKALEDGRDEFVCIMAGYPKEMDVLIAQNPGLQDRIGFYIDFPDYSPEELCEVFARFASLDGYKVSKAARERIANVMESAVAAKTEDFSNARMIRKIFERVRMDHLLKVGGKTFKAESIDRVFQAADMAKLLEGGPQRTMGFCA